MIVRSLLLRNWRLYEEAYFEFSPHVNSIIGPNAKGKTSILEALYYLVSGRSFRNVQQKDLIRHGASYFYIEASFMRHEIEQRLRISFDGKERKIFFNHTLCPSPTSLLGLLKGVRMVPDDAALIKGSPNMRRQYLDYQIAQIDPLYVHHLMRYTRALRQRNCLLKARQNSLDPWEKEMATSAAYIALQRSQTMQELDAVGCKKYAELSNSSIELKLSYKGISDPYQLKERYERMRSREMALGYTLHGPHRDEIQIDLNGKEARHFASEGQQRTCVAAMRLAEWDRLKRIAEEPPIMIMDDVNLGLDEERCHSLLQQLQEMGQLFLTSTQKLPVEGHIIRIG